MKIKTQSAKVDKAWLNAHVNDPWVKLAAKEGFRARAAYKLREIDETLGLLKPGQVVVDLGSTPGAWSQYLSRRLSPSTGWLPAATADDAARRGPVEGSIGKASSQAVIIALDLLPMLPVEGVTFIQGDFNEADVLAQVEALLSGRAVDLVLSDMAPNLSGIAASDSARVTHLVELALAFAKAHLVPNGALVAKLFHGAGYEALAQAFKAQFRVVKRIKPKASRGKSAETFLVGQGLRQPQPSVGAAGIQPPVA
ncbi:MAG: RlmE family RNA methyltransferase [Variovorax sp.]